MPLVKCSCGTQLNAPATGSYQCPKCKTAYMVATESAAVDIGGKKTAKAVHLVASSSFILIIIHLLAAVISVFLILGKTERVNGAIVFFACTVAFLVAAIPIMIIRAVASWAIRVLELLSKK